jgi:hypothetical protein
LNRSIAATLVANCPLGFGRSEVAELNAGNGEKCRNAARHAWHRLIPSNLDDHALQRGSMWIARSLILVVSQPFDALLKAENQQNIAHIRYADDNLPYVLSGSRRNGRFHVTAPARTGAKSLFGRATTPVRTSLRFWSP